MKSSLNNLSQDDLNPKAVGEGAYAIYFAFLPIDDKLNGGFNDLKLLLSLKIKSLRAPNSFEENF